MAGSRKLLYRVAVENSDGEIVWFAAGDTPPKWAAKQMGDHCFDPDAEGDGDDGDDAPAAYKDWLKPALEAEVAKRNEDRGDDDQVVVEAPGNKPELIAALEADDADQAD